MVKRMGFLVATVLLLVSAIVFLPSRSHALEIGALGQCQAKCPDGYDCIATGWFCRCWCDMGSPRCECLLH